MATKKPAAKKPAANKPAANKPAANKPAANKPAAKKATTAVAKPAATASPKKAAPKAAITSVATSSMSPALGVAAPAFSVAGNDGTTHSLASYKGKPVVLYFYPRDDTPGCTIEACDFRDNMARATAKGAVVLGVSRDTIKSHDKFTTKFNLNFPLLADEDLAVHRAYDAWGTKNMYGKQVEGTIRSTFLIDAKGVLRQSWRKVKVAGHVDAVLAALEAL